MSRFQIKDASRKQTKIKGAIEGVSGSGKTRGALLLAAGLVAEELSIPIDQVWKHICVIDTENGSATLYYNSEFDGITIGTFKHLEFDPPYTPEDYIEAINLAASFPDIKVIIIDSISHEWMGKGGILSIHNKMVEDKLSGNSYTYWAKLTPRHDALVDHIRLAKVHILMTMRSKQEYVLAETTGKDGRNKQTVEKKGMQAQQRDGMDYEQTFVLTVDQNHNVTSSKDRTQLFADRDFRLTVEEGRQIARWCQTGVSEVELAKQEADLKSKRIAQALKDIEAAQSESDVRELGASLPPQIKSDPEVAKAAQKRMEELRKSVAQ